MDKVNFTMAEFDDFEEFRARAMSAGQIQRYRFTRNKSLLERLRKTRLRRQSATDEPDKPGAVEKDRGAETIVNRLAKLSFGDSFSDHAPSDGENDIDSADDERSDDVVFENSSTSSPFHDSGIYLNSSKYGSRRCSLPASRHGARSRRPSNLPVDRAIPFRPRTHSMPSRSLIRKARKGSQGEVDPEDYVRVRTFSTSGKTVINSGDAFKHRSSSIASNCSGVSMPSKTEAFRQRAWSAPTKAAQAVAIGADQVTGPGQIPTHRVLVIGGHGVGKSALMKQFMTSEYMHDMGHDESQEDEEWKSVSVLLDGQESTLEFKDLSPIEVEPPNQTAADAYVVVYSVADKDSFDDAVDVLHELRKKQQLSCAAAILVANKYDIVRNREVEETDGKRMAIIYDCKYIEVSAVLNHKVDELLAGILKQIRLKEKKLAKRRRRCIPDENGCIPQARDMFGKILRRNQPMFRSCDNLLVL